MERMNGQLYRHTGMALLRAAREPVGSAPNVWPDVTDHTAVEKWRAWLKAAWSRRETAEAIRVASPSLARSVEEICVGSSTTVKDARRAVVAVARYLLRETSRPTPFGIFAGVASVQFGSACKVRWGGRHRPVARADAQWLADVVAHLEGCGDLLERLPVMVNNLRSVRGDRLAVPDGAARVEIRYTPAVRAVEDAARSPIPFGMLTGILAARFPGVPSSTVGGMLTELVVRRVLVTSLRAPATVTDVLGYVIDELHRVKAEELAQAAPIVRALHEVQAGLDRHNRATPGEREVARAEVEDLMRRLSATVRSPLAVDLLLDCELELPEQIARDMQAAASALLRLAAGPRGSQTWRDYHAAFLDRYGLGTLVLVTELLDPDTGLGCPAGYPGSPFEAPAPAAQLSARDDRLLTLIQQTALEGGNEIVLDDATINDLTSEDFHTARIPPHVELSARIHAVSQDALERGDYTLTVYPARAAGTMTGRFATACDGLAQVFTSLPTTDADAIPAQLSFAAAYPHAENVARTPLFLDHVITLGEHRAPDDDGTIPVHDLAVTADWHRLHLVSLSQRRPVEPQVFHALRLDKQAPPLARFLAEFPRSHTAAYTEFDWGAAARLPHLPRVRYRRTLLAPAQWRITASDLPPAWSPWPKWRDALTSWRRQWRIPDTVELRQDDRRLRLALDEPTHTAILRTELDRTGHVILPEAAAEAGFGWLGGHAHEIAVPLVSTRPATPSPLAGRLPAKITNNSHSHLPGSPQSEWFFAKIYAHPDRQNAVVTELPELLGQFGDHPLWWFLRYRSPREAHHLRLRIRVKNSQEYGACAAAVGGWAEHLRQARLAQRLVLDTYYPEVGRYGDGPALSAAETVFAADSAVVLAQLQLIPADIADPTTLAAVNMVDIACGLLGGTEASMQWLARHPIDTVAPAPRAVLDQTIALAQPSRRFTAFRDLPDGETLIATWADRRAALTLYRHQLRFRAGADPDAVLESLLHMHHVRALGLDRGSEKRCRRLARSVALSWQARRP